MTLRVRFTHSTTHYARFLCGCGAESENEFPVWGAELVYGRPDVPEGWTSRGELPRTEYTCPKCNAAHNSAYERISVEQRNA